MMGRNLQSVGKVSYNIFTYLGNPEEIFFWWIILLILILMKCCNHYWHWHQIRGLTQRNQSRNKEGQRTGHQLRRGNQNRKTPGWNERGDEVWDGWDQEIFHWKDPKPREEAESRWMSGWRIKNLQINGWNVEIPAKTRTHSQNWTKTAIWKSSPRITDSLRGKK